MTGSSYVRITVDESFLDKTVKQLELRLDRHEEMILELQRLLRDKADRYEEKELRESMMTDLDNRGSQMNSRLTALESKYDSRLKDLEDSLENRLIDMANMISENMRGRFDELEARIPKDTGNVGDLADRLQAVEETVSANGKKLNLTHDSVQHIASAIAIFRNTSATLDATLPEVMSESVNSVKGDIQTILSELSKMKDQLKMLEILKNRGQEPALSHHGKGSDFDFTTVRPYPSMIAHWRDPPELPAIHPFVDLGELVDYVYKLLPKLQAHLLAMHGKIVENAADVLGKVDRPLVEKMFEKFQAVIADMVGRVDDLKESVEETATRDEINGMIDEILNSLSQEGQTAVGRMKCMACGRDIPQVSGAVPENEARRALGTPPNSMVFNAPAVKIGVQFQTKEGFDSGIVESPRSVRPFKHGAKSLKNSKAKGSRS
jgi:hypothetical protein